MLPAVKFRESISIAFMMALNGLQIIGTWCSRAPEKSPMVRLLYVVYLIHV